MPKKTKKEKIKSQYRHGNPAPVSISLEYKPSPVSETPNHPTFSFRGLSQNPTQSLSTSVQTQETFNYLRGDLIKTVVLALLACGILVGLSFILK